jgi:pimeloyl-ACP methyl ester carboxylesterase
MSRIAVNGVELHCERDEPCVQTSQSMGRVIPGAGVWKVPKATPFANLDEPAELNRQVPAFLAAQVAVGR